MPKFDVDDALVRKLAALLTDTGLTEIEYEVGEQRIRVSRGGMTTVAMAAPASVAAPRRREAGGRRRPAGGRGDVAHGRHGLWRARNQAPPPS